jgi:translation initiation factor IF-2
MRVYEFAKQIGLSSKDIIEELKKGGFDVKSHMSVVDEKAVAYIEKKYKPKQETSPSAPPVSKKIQGKPEKKVIMEKQLIKSKPPKKVLFKKIKPEPQKAPEPQSIIIQPMSVDDVAQKAAKPVNEVILTLLRWGIAATKNQIIPEDIVARLAELYELEVVKPTENEKEIKKTILSESKNLQERLPVVVVLGHVDHGKTTLLDFVRNTRVAMKEKGGITQHLGAYEATTSHGSVIFLDTPGHEAFSAIRQRGIKVADLAVIVVAADDGLMPQTVEAIKFAKTMNVPIIIAINKVDKVDQSRIEVVKRQLSQHDLLPEDWGGDTICIPISAKFGEGVDKLLEMLVLQSQILELRTDITGAAKGYVLESKLEKGRGAVATLICQFGTVHIGDYFVCGSTGGRVNSLVDSYGKRLEKAGPSVPVQVAGFVDLPQAGDYFEVVPKQDYRKVLAQAQEHKNITTATRLMTEGAINLVVKTDTDSSKEALLSSIEKLSKKVETGFNIIHAAVGNISESDIELAFNTGANIIGLHVKVEAKAATLAQRRNVSVTLFDIIYKLLEDLEARAESIKEVEMVSTKIGEAIVIRVFDIKNIGVIAGAQIKDGRFSRDGSVVVWRGTEKVGGGKIRSLQREKKTVKEVHTGFECGFMVEGFNDFKVDDRVECFLEMPAK